MRKLFFPLFLFLGLLVAGVALQHEAGKRRQALEDSLGGPRLGVSLETAAAFARQLETVDQNAPASYLQAPLPQPVAPDSVANADE